MAATFSEYVDPLPEVWNGRWREPPAHTHHTSGVVAAGSLSLVSKGLPEYEAIPNGDGVDLALTLLRSVGFLSLGDLETRAGAQEPHIPTPDAECLGRNLNQPHHYHNGGIWPFVGGINVAALVKAGRQSEAERQLDRLAELNSLGRQQP